MSAEIKEKSRRRRKQQEEAAEEEVQDKGITPSKGRATPGRRNRSKNTDQGNIITRPVRGIREYFRGVRDELDKVTWPTRDELLRLSRIVFFVTVAASIVLGMINLAYNELFIIGLDAPWVFVIFFIIAGALIFLGRRLMASRGGDPASF
jgi:preprotein translocase SecE subunit